MWGLKYNMEPPPLQKKNKTTIQLYFCTLKISERYLLLERSWRGEDSPQRENKENICKHRMFSLTCTIPSHWRLSTLVKLWENRAWEVGNREEWDFYHSQQTNFLRFTWRNLDSLNGGEIQEVQWTFLWYFRTSTDEWFGKTVEFGQ